MAGLDLFSRSGPGGKELETLYIEFSSEIQENLQTLRPFRMKRPRIMLKIIPIDHHSRPGHN